MIPAPDPARHRQQLTIANLQDPPVPPPQPPVPPPEPPVPPPQPPVPPPEPPVPPPVPEPPPEPQPLPQWTRPGAPFRDRRVDWSRRRCRFEMHWHSSAPTFGIGAALRHHELGNRGHDYLDAGDLVSASCDVPFVACCEHCGARPAFQFHGAGPRR